MQLCTASRIHAQLAASHGQRPTLWLDDDHSSEDEMPLASLICITSSPEFIRHHRTGEATTSGTTRPKSHVGAKEDVPWFGDRGTVGRMGNGTSFKIRLLFGGGWVVGILNLVSPDNLLRSYCSVPSRNLVAALLHTSQR